MEHVQAVVDSQREYEDRQQVGELAPFDERMAGGVAEDHPPADEAMHPQQAEA